MRYYRLIVLLLIFASCKTSTVPSASADYYEDLSHLRPGITNDKGVTEIPVVEDQPESVSVTFTKDITLEIDSISRMIIQENKEKVYWDGYTIQIYRGNSRSDAQSALEKARDLFPEYDPSIRYYQPTFRVKMGSYFDRVKANKAFQEVKEYFPSALLLPEKLKLPKSESVD